MDDLTILTECALFHGLREAQIREMLPCLSARQSRFRRGQFLLRAGDRVAFAGILLSGEAEVLQEDFWGNRNIMARITQGGIFAESFACTGEKLTDLEAFHPEREICLPRRSPARTLFRR